MPGLYAIQHDPQFRIVVLFTQDGQETIQPYIDNEPLEYYVDLRITKVPLLELVSAQETVLNTVDELGKCLLNLELMSSKIGLSCM